MNNSMLDSIRRFNVVLDFNKNKAIKHNDYDYIRFLMENNYETFTIRDLNKCIRGNKRLITITILNDIKPTMATIKLLYDNNMGELIPQILSRKGLYYTELKMRCYKWNEEFMNTLYNIRKS